MLAERHLPRSGNSFGNAGDQFLRQVHQVAVIAVCLIELQHRKFGIVMGGNPFVPEDAAQFINPVYSADDQALEVQFQRDSQIEFDIQGVVVRVKRTGQRATGDRLKDGRFHLEVSPFIQKIADFADDLAALDENRADVRIHNKIHISLSEPCLHIREPVPFFRQGQKILGQVEDPGCGDREFVRARAENGPFRPDDIAEIEQLKQLEIFGPDEIPAHIYLEPVLAVGKVHESGFPVRTQRNDAAADAHGFFSLLEFGAADRVKLCPELADGVRVFEFVRVRIVAQALQFRQLETALFQKISLAFHCSFASCPLIHF